MSDREYLTQAKFDEFKKELEYLKTIKRTEIAKALAFASSLGDKSENAEYHEARDAQGHTEDRVNFLESLLKSATVVSAHDTSTISVGSVVTVQKESDSSKRVFTFVGSEESDAPSGKISVRSPLGMAAMGKAKGETFSFTTPSGSMTYKVITIE